MTHFSRSVDGRKLPHARCRHCHQEIVEAAEIGWLDPTPGDSYDVCPDSPYGDHEPSDERGDASGYGPWLMRGAPPA